MRRLLLPALALTLLACPEPPAPDLKPKPVPVKPPPPTPTPPPKRVPPPDPPPPAALPYDTSTLDGRRDRSDNLLDNESTRAIVKEHPEVAATPAPNPNAPPGMWRPGTVPPLPSADQIQAGIGMGTPALPASVRGSSPPPDGKAASSGGSP